MKPRRYYFLLFVLCVSFSLYTSADSIDDLFSVPDSTATEDLEDSGDSGDSPADDDADDNADGSEGAEETDDQNNGQSEGDDEEAYDDQSEDADPSDGQAADAQEAQEQQLVQTVDVDALTTSPPKVKGNVTAAVGAGAGLMEWPGSSAAQGRDIKELTRYSGFFQNDVKLSFDVRPKSYIRFHTELETSLNDQEMNYSTPDIDEIFIDYTLGDTVFFRAGKQNLTWGQGRLLDNPANLVSRVSDGAGMRSTFPAWKGTVGTVIYTKKPWVEKHNEYDPKAFAYAAQWENTFGPITLNLMGHFMNDEDIGSAAALSFGLGPLNLAADLVADWDRHEPLNEPTNWQAMGQIGWDRDDPDWSLLVEYQYDSQVENHEGHRAALAVQMPGLYKSDWKPKLRWKHAFQDNSGEIVAGIEGGIAPSLKLSLALPVIYGDVGSFYRAALTEGVENLGDDEEYNVPVDNVISLLASIKLSFSF